MAETVWYGAEDWGVGELWLDGETLLWHELPGARHEDVGVHLLHPLADRLAAYFTGARAAFGDVELDLDGYTTFQRAVVETLRGVPWGEVVTYGELAALAGAPGAARAAGTFCARNRIGLFIPCHRVVAAGGLGSYGSLGLEYKRRLLELERVPLG